MVDAIVCPYCRSQLRATGHIDMAAPAISYVPCPVCGYKISIPSVLGSGMLATLLPMTWDGFQILMRNDPAMPWSDFVNQKPELKATLDTPIPETTKSIWTGFTLNPFSLYPGLGSATMIIAAVGILILIIAIKHK